MNGIPDRETISLVVRLWREGRPVDRTRLWRGQIEHVESGEVSHFQLPQGLIDFLVALVESQQTLGQQPTTPAALLQEELS